MQSNSIQEYIHSCTEQNKSPKAISTLDDYNKTHNWKSKYIGKRVQLKADGSITLV